MLPDHLTPTLLEKKRTHAYRQRVCAYPTEVEILIDGKRYLNFSGNDYLGLASDRDLRQQYQQISVNLGSTGSPLINGYHPAHQALEETICEWLGFERCLLFNSGYSANSSVLKTLLDKPAQTIIQDKLNHASLIEGAIHSSASHLRYKHNDMAHLAQRLNKTKDYRLVVSEGVFSMDGDQAPIADILQQTQTQNAGFMLDDAHGIGVFGEQGRGSLSQQNISPSQVDVFTATFGKALGSSGAFVAGKQELIDYLVNHAGSYIFSTSMSPWLAAASQLAIEKMRQESWRQDKLQQNIHCFKAQLAQFELPDSGSFSSIQPLIVGDNQTTLKLAKVLREKGFWVTAIRPPTVPLGQARLRITLTSLHTTEQISALCQTLARYYPQELRHAL